MFQQAFLLLVAVITVHSSSLSESLTLVEQHRLQQTLNKPPKDLESLYYSVTGTNAIGRTSDDKEGLCNFASGNLDNKNVKAAFQYSEVIRILECKNPTKISFDDVMSDAKTALEYARGLAAMANLGATISGDKLKKFIDLAKENDTPGSAGAVFYAAGLLPKSDTLKPIVSMVEDIVAQADEINGESLQFEGGLAVTSSVVTGIMKLSEQQGMKLIKDDQASKFAKYLLNRKYVYNLMDIHFLTTALSALANNKIQVPAVVSVFKSRFITKENPILKVRVTNVLDQSIPEATATAKDMMTADETVTIFDNKKFTKSTNKDDVIVIDNEVARGYVNAHAYDLDVMASNPKRGMYKCKIGVSIKDGKQYVKAEVYTVNLKVLSHVMVEDVSVAVGERDRSVGKAVKLVYPNKLENVIEADTHQKVVMNFDLKAINTGKKVTAHQTFIRLTNVETQQEVFFVAQPDSSLHYTFTLDVSGTAKDSFNHQSGRYKITLIVGDATMQIPINWPLGEIDLKFTGTPKKSKRSERLTNPRPIIEHMFRVPEKRPPKIVSTIFTALVLSPLALMFILWLKIGANLSNLNFSISTLVFHVGLAGIFVLYYCFWIQLNMFQTLKLLAVIGGATFLGGNQMLADMAAAKYKA